MLNNKANGKYETIRAKSQQRQAVTIIIKNYFSPDAKIVRRQSNIKRPIM